MSKNDPDDKKTCKQLVRSRRDSTVAKLKIMVAAYRIGETDYDGVKEVFDRREAFKTRFVKSPLRDPNVVASDKEFYRDEKAEIASLIAEFSSEERYVFDNVGDVECYGGQRGFEDYGLCLDYKEYDRKFKYGGFFAWVLSTGGPHTEIQFYTELDSPKFTLRDAKFCYKDWYDGATCEFTAEQFKTIEWCYQNHRDSGWFETVYEKHREDDRIPVGHCSDR